LEAQRIQFPNIGEVMSDEECRSSLASTARGGQPHGEPQGHEQPLPSIELDMIDNLAQPITCNLILLVRGSF
jgi:hypothetical protein